MSDTLVIECPSGDLSALHWALVDADSSALVSPGTGPVADLPTGDADAPLNSVLVVDGRMITERFEVLPARSDAQARATAPYVIEDDLATSPDDLHVAVGPLEGEQRRLAVTDRAWLSGLLDDIESEGRRISAVYADHALLAVGAEHDAVLAINDGCLIVSLKGQPGASMDLSLVDALLPALLESADAVTLFGGDAMDKARIQASLGREVEHQPHWPVPRLSLYHQANLAGEALNLRQGFLAAKRNWGPIFKTWSRVAGLAALGLVLLFGGQVIEAYSLHARAAQLDSESAALRQTAVPGQGSNAALAAHVRALEAGTSDRFLILSALLFEAMAGEDDIALISLRFDDERGALVASLNAASFDAMQALGTAVRDRGGQVREGASRESGGRILGDITLSLEQG